MEPTATSGTAITRRVLLSGASGLIGRHLRRALTAEGRTVVPLLRPGAPGEGIRPGPDGLFAPRDLAGFDAVVHLAGEPVAAGRWTPERKRRIRDSRVDGTRKLAAALLASGQPPRVFLCASGVNFYGGSPEQVLEETAPAGQGFLAEVCVAWEQAADLLQQAATRMVKLRLGAVLSPEGGALQAMMPLVRAGLAGPIAGGRQYLSWISLQDTVRALQHLLYRSTLRGAVNVVSPVAVTSRGFTQALAAAVGRLAVVPVPAWATRLALGEMANETVLASVRAVPRRLLDDGFTFQDADLATYLRRTLTHQSA